MGRQNDRTYDKEKSEISVVKYDQEGFHFEVAVNANLVFKYRRGEDNITADEVLRSRRIFTNATEGTEVFDGSLKRVFDTTDNFDAAKQILQDGNVELTPYHRQQLHRQRKRALLDMIVEKTIDPRTDTPHPRNRVKKILEHGGIDINEFKPAEQQLWNVINQVREHIPLDVQKRIIDITVPQDKSYELRDHLENYGEILEEDWGGERYTCKLRVPAGLQNDFLQKANAITKGDIQTVVNKEAST
mgnify:CR=1 FL=1